MTQRKKDELFEKCCEDNYIPIPKKNFYIKDNKKIWPEDEKMKQQLELYDQAHSRAKCISEKYLKQLEDDINAYIADRVEPICMNEASSVISCIDNKGNLTKCNREMEEFQRCISKTVNQLYQRKFLYG